MPANFPANPTTNQVYVYNGTSWVWTGQRWQVQLGTVLVGATGPVGATGASANLLSVTSNIVPDTHQVYDLGTNTQRWRDLYLSGNSFYLGNTILTSTGNTLQLPAGSTIGGIPVADTGQVTQIASTASPKIANVKVTDNSWTVLDDTAIDTAGGYIVINGAGFVSVPQVYINAVAATSVSYVNSTQLRVQVPAFAAGTYPLYVINSDGGTGILVPGISFSGFPNWSTPAAGNVGLNYETDTITPVSLSASSNSAVTYFLASGALPPGVTLSGSTISGTTQSTASNTTYNFTIEARDAENQSTLRAFSITVNTDVVSWATPANAVVISGYEYGTVSQSLSASSLAGKSITYSGSNLPGNIQVTGTNVAGNLGAATNATTASNTAATITATANITARTANRTIFFVANPDQVTWASPTSNGVVTGYEFSNLSAALSATSAAGRTVAYSSGDLPTNITITGSTLGGLLGAVGNASSNLTATAATTNRANTIPVTIQTIADVVTWSAPTNSQTIAIDATSSVNQALSATSAAGKTITYTANNLPTGLSVVGAAVTGTPTGYTTSTTVSSNLTATAATTNRSSTISITWSINLAITFVTDPLFANVSLLLNAASNASVISDASSNNLQLTPVGDVRASTFSPYGTGWSVQFDGNDSLYGTTAVVPATSAFTIEMWVYIATTANDVQFFAQYSAGTAGRFIVDYSNTGYAGATDKFVFSVGGVGALLQASSTSTRNAWHHLVMGRNNSNNWAMWVDGTRLATATNSVSLEQRLPVIGDYLSSGSGYGLNGYISNLRVITSDYYGVGNSTITVPTSPLTSVANTSLLTCHDNRFRDGSTNNFTLTRNGDVAVRSFNPFNLVNTGTAGSMYFDGTNDYLTINYPASSAFGTGDFTFETWVYPITSIGNSFYFFIIDVNTTGAYIGYDAAGTLGIGQRNTVMNNTVSYTFPISSWTHFAVTRAGTAINFYINGTSILSGTNSINYSGSGTTYIGGSIGSSNFNGYLADFRIIKGRAVYPTTYPEAALTTANNTVLLLNNSLTNNATNNTFLDSSANNFAITRNGNVTQGSFSPFSPGGWSNYFDGSGDSLTFTRTAPVNFGSGDFTAEAWVYVTGSNTYAEVVGNGRYGSTGGWYIMIQNGTTIRVDVNTASINYTTTLLHRWSHIAVTRTGSGTNNIKLYFNGRLSGQTTYAGTTEDGTIGSLIEIGRHGNSGTGNDYFTGYISNVRLIKGVAVYTSDFVPATSTLAVTAETSLLTCHANRFIDASVNNYALSVGGDTRVVAFSPFTPAAYVPATHGGSAYFDGTGDYLETPATSNLAFGTGPFTIECWVYPTVAGTRRNLVGITNNIGNTDPGLFLTTGNKAQFGMTTNDVFTGTIDVLVNAWSHIAVTYDGTTYRLFVNGALDVTSTVSAYNYSYASVGWQIGKWPYSASGLMTGYISNLRIVKGYALYTASFTVPAAPVAAVYGTQLLLNATNAAIWDASGRNNLETIGDAKVSTAVGRYSLSSLYFDGTGDYIQPPDSPLYDFGTGDFTVEAWAYPTVISSDHYIFSMTTSTGDAGHFSINIYQSNWRAGLFNNYMPVNGTVSASSALNSWSHVALVRASNTLYFFVNGVSIGTPVSVSGVAINCAGVLRIGTYAISSINFTGYISDVKITAGQALYTTSFSVPTRSLTAVDRTQLLTLQNNQPHNNHTFQDSGPYNHLITRAGNASQGTFSPFAPGGWSSYFPGSSYITTPNVGSITGDFTVELWYNPNSSMSQNWYPYVFGSNSPWTGSGGMGLFYDTQSGVSDSVILYFNVQGTNIQVGTNGTLKNTWSHLAMARSGSTIRAFLNGKQLATTITNSGTINTTTVLIGGVDSPSYANQPIMGYIKDFRLIKGTALYTTDFSRPTSALTAVTNTAVLTCHANRIFDASANNYALTISGSPSVQAWSPFAPTASYSPAIHGGSAYFDGSGDYLTAGNGASETNLNGDSSIEVWFYPLATNKVLTAKYSGGTNQFFINCDSSNKIYAEYLGSTFYAKTSTGSYTLNAWNHLLVTKSSTTAKMWLNGVYEGSWTVSSVNSSTNAIGIGGTTIGGTSFNGYIGGAKYSNMAVETGTSNITVPTTPMTAGIGTVLFLNFVADGIEDRSGRGVLETVADARHSRAVTKFANTSSMYFDGTGDNILAPTSSLMEFGTGNFTVEFWFFKSANGSIGDSVGEFFVRIGDTGATVNSIVISTNNSQQVTGYIGYTGGTWATTIVSSTTFSLNTWHHVAFVRSGTGSNQTILYVNGINVGTGTSSTNLTAASYGTQTRIGSSASDRYFNGYIQDLRITRAARYQPAAPTANLTVSSSTVLLVPGGTGNNIIRDASANNFMLTPYGDVRATNFTPYGTGWSAYFDGNGDYLTAASNSLLNIASGDFTVECWVFRASTQLSTYPRIVTIGNANYNSFILWTNGTAIWVTASTNGTTWVDMTFGTITNDTWTHLAVVRSSGTIKLYQNGIAHANTYSYSTFVIPTPVLYIGVLSWVQADHYWTGYISNLRIVNGTAVYTANFIPPTAPLTAVANTVLLACHTNRFMDGSTNNFAITRNGDTAVRSFNPFNITNTGVNGSMYFDGTTDYVDVTSTLFNPSGAFTIEFWFYPTLGTSAEQGILSSWPSGLSPAEGILFWKTNPNGFEVAIGNGTVIVATGTWSNFLNQWNHCVLVRNASNSCAVFLNGTRLAAPVTKSGAPLRTLLSIGRAFPNNTGWNFQGSIADLRYVTGSAVYDPAQSTITVPTAPLTAVANTSLLTLQYRQPHNNHSFQDSSSNQFLITRSGNATQGTFSPFPLSGWSNYFDGTSFLRTPTNGNLSIGTQDFTLECWFYAITNTTFAGSFVQRYAGDYGMTCYPQGFFYKRDNGYEFSCNAPAVPTLNAWHHWAVSRSGTTVSFWLDGIRQNSVTIAANESIFSDRIVIGDYGAGGGDGGQYRSNYPGYIKDFRLVIGRTVYGVTATSFTVPTTDLAVVPNTRLLTCQSRTFTDNSPFNISVLNGIGSSFRVVNSIPFTPATYTPAVHGGSAYFDGTGDYITAPVSDIFNFGTSDWTIECWVYQLSRTASQYDVVWALNGPGVTGTVPYRSGMYLSLGAAGGGFLVSNSSENGWAVNISGVTLPVLYSWEHYAVTRSGSTWTVYKNGVSVGTASSSSGVINNRSPFVIGTQGLEGDTYWDGYIANFRILKGTAAYTSAFTPPTSLVTATTNTSLLLNFTDAAVADQDATNVLETVADAREVNFGPLMSNYSVYFDGNGDYLSLADNSAFAMGSGNWTLECWLYLNSYTGTSAYGFMYDGRPTSTNGWYLTLYHNNGVVRFFTNGTGVINSDEGTIVTLAVGQWYHIAVSKSGNATKMFINGSQTGNTYTDTNTYVNGSSRPFIGANGHTLSDYLNGYISNLRIIKGTALHTTNFTPSTTPLTAVPGTSLLTCHANRFRDASTNNFTVTRNGDAKVTDFSPFGAQVATPPSMYFDGTGDYLSLPSTSMHDFTGDLTIEGWIYANTLTASGSLGFSILGKSVSANDGRTQIFVYCDTTTASRGNCLSISLVGTNEIVVPSSFAFVPKAWYHFAIVKYGSSPTTQIYINGTLAITSTTNVWNTATSALYIGYGTGNGGLNWNGYISDLRITRGRVLYGGFEPPTQAFPTR